MSAATKQEQLQLNENLSTACRDGNVTEVNTLLSRGGDMNYHKEHGLKRTPLHLSAMNGHEDVVKLLLEQNNIVVDARNAEGGSPLHECAAWDHPAVAELLLDAGASLSLVDKDGDSALNIAAYHGHLDTVKLLLLKGADLSVCNKLGNSALHDAAFRGHLDTLKFLLQHGADQLLRNNDDQTAIDRARESNKLKIVQYLEEVGSSFTVKVLLEAVSNVTDWHGLGRRLGLKMCQLRTIEHDYKVDGVERMMAEMFDVWLKSYSSASWADLIIALRAMGEDRVANDIIAARHTSVFRPVPSTNPDKVARTSCWQQIWDSLVQFTNLCTSREALAVVIFILAVVFVLFYKY